MERKDVAAEDEHPSEMGIRAAKEAVERAGIDPGEIDLIVYCGAGFYDYRIWICCRQDPGGAGGRRLLRLRAWPPQGLGTPY
ncbi:hypothetical protein [Candidatus Methanocrinis natronophilus]|uniref:Uncharacterized protein n=1 Tax=Candidatus Methanocrinis natronophilus TaxID=3033396 RepID=A0ABT5X5I3_9EURY|nr:hypothetical protein [Candidatus Methanocrinis natronophilus]MDF0589951.1 hypothetical protein [Candidatus Methanocrinis natronophilus]